jgi:hypothetical protein
MAAPIRAPMTAARRRSPPDRRRRPIAAPMTAARVSWPPPIDPRSPRPAANAGPQRHPDDRSTPLIAAAPNVRPADGRGRRPIAPRLPPHESS